VWRMTRQRPLPQRMETVLQEVIMGPDGKPAPAQTSVAQKFVLSRGQKIYLGPTPGLATTDNLFDLGVPGGFLSLQEFNFKLHHNKSGKDEAFCRNTSFSVIDVKGSKRTVKLAMRRLPDPKSAAAKRK